MVSEPHLGGPISGDIETDREIAFDSCEFEKKDDRFSLSFLGTFVHDNSVNIVVNAHDLEWTSGSIEE